MSPGTIYQSIEILSKEKGIEPKIILDAVKDAMLVAARKHFHTTEDMVAEFDERTGAIQIFGMEELKFVHALAEIDDVAARAGADRADWSMALEPKSASYFDGILSGMVGQRSYYLKEDLIYEMLGHLDLREPAFIRYSAAYGAFTKLGYPFGDRPDLELAIKGCPLLTGVRAPRSA